MRKEIRERNKARAIKRSHKLAKEAARAKRRAEREAVAN